jgi:hypothetical protein
MNLKQLNEQLASLKIKYEDAVINKASADELKIILKNIDDLNRKIAHAGADRLH